MSRSSNMLQYSGSSALLMAEAVTATTGILFNSGFFFRSAVAFLPSIMGIFKSVRIMSGLDSVAFSNSSLPFEAVMISILVFLRISLKQLRLWMLSSAIRAVVSSNSRISLFSRIGIVFPNPLFTLSNVMVKVVPF